MAITDKTGAEIAIENNAQGKAFEIRLVAEDTIAGKAHYLEADGERIFYHTVVDEAFGGRGLGTALVNESLQASLRDNVTVVPVCPMFKSFLDKNGDAYAAEGGSTREATQADIDAVRRA
ncbi:GNAT family N-acetyltransferase [Dietzia timorensis]|uniref:N-acetyltransferase domain-containing protein n=1 Tax=Dietzia timorensis TaxID=499555 RepID=A0A173LL05_9ACTN|nr:GNAT family N-acetyltransferase [Dietzia timorensis]ANI91997.1 Hypothetical protein BJL86_1212 [Dietzia timorensis]